MPTYSIPTQAAYAPPRDDPWSPGPEVDLPTASRYLRFVARALDWVIFFIVLIPIGVVGYASEQVMGEATGDSVAILLLLGYWAFQAWLLATTGQTLGKRVVAIKVVALDGSNAGFWRAVVAREWGPQLLWLFLLKPLFDLVSVLVMFGSDRRSLYDYLARTVVVQNDQ